MIIEVTSTTKTRVNMQTCLENTGIALLPIIGTAVLLLGLSVYTHWRKPKKYRLHSMISLLVAVLVPMSLPNHGLAAATDCGSPVTLGAANQTAAQPLHTAPVVTNVNISQPLVTMLGTTDGISPATLATVYTGSGAGTTYFTPLLLASGTTYDGATFDMNTVDLDSATQGVQQSVTITIAGVPVVISYEAASDQLYLVAQNITSIFGIENITPLSEVTPLPPIVTIYYSVKDSTGAASNTASITFTTNTSATLVT
jgi:hypothetical protein